MTGNEGATTKPIRLLLVEDEVRLARSLAQRLEGVGFAVETAAKGEVALRTCEDGEYGIVVLDLNLPDISGFQVLATLRGRERRLPVLVLSAREDVGDRVEALRLGADDYLVKPFDFGELHARIDGILRRTGHAGFTLLEVEDLTADVVRRKVIRAGREIHLSPRLFELLETRVRQVEGDRDCGGAVRCKPLVRQVEVQGKVEAAGAKLVPELLGSLGQCAFDGQRQISHP